MINSYTGEVFVDVAKVRDVAFKRANDKDPNRREDTMIHHHKYSEPCAQPKDHTNLVAEGHEYIAKKTEEEKTDA